VGLTYVINGVEAKTDATGHFSYKAGDYITFKVGDIELGTALGKPFLSPVALAMGATSEADPTVTNISKFLQTIDNDKNPSNGIELTAAIHAAAKSKDIKFTNSTAIYDADTDVALAYATLNGAVPHPAVNNADARAHLRNTLFEAMTGTYRGNYSGSGSGTFNFTTNSAGVITIGQINQAAPSPAISITGNISSAGVFSSLNNPGTLNVIGAVTLDFEGTVSASTSTVAGTWKIKNGGGSTIYGGTFSGQK
jgi:hypothetical protein